MKTPEAITASESKQASKLVTVISQERVQMNLDAGRLVPLTEKVGLDNEDRTAHPIAFTRLTKPGRQLAGRVTNRLINEEWLDLDQLSNLPPEYQFLARELKALFGAQAEIGALLAQGPVSAEWFLNAAGIYFSAHKERFIRKSQAQEGKPGRIELTAQGKRTAEAVYLWLERQYPEVGLIQLEDLLSKSLGETKEVRLLRSSLRSQIRWQEEIRLYEMLEQQSVSEVLFQGEGAVGFERELRAIITREEKRQDRTIKIHAEIAGFNLDLALAEEELKLSKENARLIASEQIPQGLREKMAWGIRRFRKWLREGGSMKLAHAAVASIILLVLFNGLLPGEKCEARENKEPKSPRLPDHRPHGRQWKAAEIEGQPILGQVVNAAPVEKVVPQETAAAPKVQETPPAVKNTRTPPPAGNPTPSVTPELRRALNQEEPILRIGKYIDHQADEDPGSAFKAKCVHIQVNSGGLLDKPPEDRLGIYEPGVTYKGNQQITANGDAVVFGENIMHLAERYPWLQEKYAQQLSWRLEGLQKGDLVEFAGLKYEVIQIEQVVPTASVSELFTTTVSDLGRRLVLMTCETPGPEETSRNASLPRTAVTAVLRG